ncbi:hypothetical protein [Hymenobacter sp. GOD-10R]|uniref:hypothetical protein n=1 Tax=Hymenobacter sp. GOD-10R TaxID=3093922 RepID=UPI002D7A00B3|nr:hypothetical protein [Hymenobacter sp. GOD-10R]WRQ31803.1 hypothetical protein SD425_28560 [Hymenobacter sp. GOD-10R]
MKWIYAVLIAGLVGCNRSSEENVKAEVGDFMREQLADPTSYQPLSYTYRAYTRVDSLTRHQAALEQLRDAKLDSGLAISAQHEVSDQEIMVEQARFSREAAALTEQMVQLAGFGDTTRIATRVEHAFRAKNQAGTPIKSKESLLVYPNGVVQVLE